MPRTGAVVSTDSDRASCTGPARGCGVPSKSRYVKKIRTPSFSKLDHTTTTPPPFCVPSASRGSGVNSVCWAAGPVMSLARRPPQEAMNLLRCSVVSFVSEFVCLSRSPCLCVSPGLSVSLSLCLPAHPTPPGWLCCAPRPFEVAVQRENGLRWVVDRQPCRPYEEVHCSPATLCSGRIYEDARAAGGVGGRMRAVVGGGWETDQTARELFLPRQPQKPVEGKFSPDHVL